MAPNTLVDVSGGHARHSVCCCLLVRLIRALEIVIRLIAATVMTKVNLRAVCAAQFFLNVPRGEDTDPVFFSILRLGPE